MSQKEIKSLDLDKLCEEIEKHNFNNSEPYRRLVSLHQEIDKLKAELETLRQDLDHKETAYCNLDDINLKLNEDLAKERKLSAKLREQRDSWIGQAHVSLGQDARVKSVAAAIKVDDYYLTKEVEGVCQP